MFIEGIADSGPLAALFSGGAPGASGGHVRLRVTAPSCDPCSGTLTADPLASLKACAPAGWTASPFPAGARDFALRDGQIRLITPASVADRPRSTATVTFITDWWTVTDHDTISIVFADGRSGTQYRSKAGKTHITTELALPSGTWQLYAVSDEQYDAVLRCVEPRLAGASR